MEVLESRDFDLLLFDVNLPTMSGYALCSWYKTMCRSRGRKAGYVVAVTADPDDGNCASFGLDRCLAKPIGTAGVVELMQGFWKANSQPPSPAARPAMGWEAQARDIS